MLVHVEHLLAVEMDGGEGNSEEREEEDRAPGIGESPEFEFGEIAGEEKEAKEISDEDEGGVTLEGRVGASEGDFTEAEEEDFDEGDGAGGEDDRVHEGGWQAPGEVSEQKTERDERSERKSQQDFAGDGTGLESIGIDPKSKDPVRTERGGEFEGETNADDDAETEKKGDGEEVVGGSAKHVGEAYGCRLSVKCGSESLRGEDQAKRDEGGGNLEMSFAAEKRAGDEMEAGTLRRVAENKAIEEAHGEQAELGAGKWTGFGSFRDADEGAAEADGVGEDRDRNGQAESEASALSHRSVVRVGAVAPERFADADEPNRREREHGAFAEECELTEERRDGETAG